MKDKTNKPKRARAPRVRTTTTPKRCLCGESYDEFRGPLSFADARRQMTAGPSDDPSQWRQKGRRSVLGYMREQKIAAWHLRHGACPREAIALVGGVQVPFASVAAASAYALTRARMARRPIVTTVIIGAVEVARFAGDWRGAARAIPVETVESEPDLDTSFDVAAFEAAA